MWRIERIGEDMLKSIVCAGVGGQGALTLGTLLAEAAAKQGMDVTYVPEYGAEMRGGNSSCKVRIGDETIVSPFMEDADILVALHSKTLPLYINLVSAGSIIVAESTLVHDIEAPEGVTIVNVPATEIADNMKNSRGMSAVMAGAIVAVSDLFPFEDAVNAVAEYYEEKHLPVDINKEAFIAGYNYIKK